MPTQKENIMKVLGVSAEEADAILASDKAIDRGEKQDFDLDPDKAKVAKKFTNVQGHKKPTVYSFQKRERKENTTKSGIIADLFKFLTETSELSYENTVISNKERQIAFESGGHKYELTLVQKREPKK